jgi:hypothetical protein
MNKVLSFLFLAVFLNGSASAESSAASDFELILIVICFFGFWLLVGHFWGEEDPLAQKSIYQERREKKEREKAGVEEKGLSDMSEIDKISYEVSLLRLTGRSDEDIAKNLGLELKDGEFYFEEKIIKSDSQIESNDLENNFEYKKPIYKIGMLVRHPQFGVGTIVGSKGSGDSKSIQIKFQKDKTRWLIAAYTNLTII